MKPDPEVPLPREKEEDSSLKTTTDTTAGVARATTFATLGKDLDPVAIELD